MRYRITLFCVSAFLLFPAVSVFSQDGDEEGDRPLFSTSGLLKKSIANNKFKNNNFSGAVSYYESLLGSDPENPGLNFKAGLCYFKMKEYGIAIRFFSRCFAKNSEDKEEAHFYLGRSYHLTNEPDKAITEYTEFKKRVGTARANARGLDLLIGQCKFAKEQMDNPALVIVKNAGKNINSMYADYAPAVTADGKVLVFTSRRDNTTGYGKDPDDRKYFEDIYISSFDSIENEWSGPRSISELINSAAHDASLSMSPQGNILYVYKNIRGGDIYETRLSNEGNWLPPVPLPYGINSGSFESSATVTGDGKTLYFISERPGGLGKGDIYFARKQRDGTWGDAENIGKKINTSEDELCCYITPDGNTLFFSTKGHKGMGGYDIFRTQLVNGKWTEPVNLGYPVNSTNDDLHFYLTNNKQTAWFSSTRADNNTDRDIFIADLSAAPELVSPKIESPEVTEAEIRLLDSLLAAIPPKSVQPTPVNPGGEMAKDKRTIVSGKVLEPNGKGVSAEIVLHSGTPVPHFITDERGHFSISPDNLEMSFASVEALKTGYQAFGSQELTVNDNDADNSTEMHFVLRLKQVCADSVAKLNKALDENPNMIMFAFASSTLILNEGRNEKLDHIAEELKNNRKLRAELDGYTDLIGTPLYNKQLSLNRAYAVAAYLKEKGVPEKRLTVNGFGTSNSIATNETEEGRRTNRRVEIKVK